MDIDDILTDIEDDTALCPEVKYGDVGRIAPHITVSVLNVIAHRHRIS